ASAMFLIAGNQVGTVGQDIHVQGFATGPQTVVQIQLGAADAQAYVNAGATARTAVGSLAPEARSLAVEFGIVVNADGSVTNAAQSSASREQSGGQDESGTIDSSLFEEISLYAVDQGVRLPRDQREDEEDDYPLDDECDEDDLDCEAAVISAALSAPSNVAVVEGFGAG
ncbi:MAG: hypothetical protein LC632_05295, partial [Xanthomonadaceae bacterium]|nr:hypothetical protein [Xanthomonadaceae bacterium]